MSARKPLFSVIIPAHNEAAVIERCLSALFQGAPAGALEVIVVCNGCTDDTAAIARASHPDLIVIELAKGSKPAALNAGNRIARAYPRFFVDADIEVSYRSLEATARLMEITGALAAAPAIDVDLSHASPAVRAFYRVWRHTAYVNDGLVGAGLYGLSEDGVRRVSTFPEIIADDMFVHALFSRSERINLGAFPMRRLATFTVRPPRTLGALIAVEARRLSGQEELAALMPQLRQAAPNRLSRLAPLLLSPLRWPDLACYTWVKLASRRLYLQQKRCGGHLRWTRDDTSRQNDRETAKTH